MPFPRPRRPVDRSCSRWLQTLVHYYVWYRIGGDPRPVRAAIVAVMADVYRVSGVSGRLLQRLDQPDTWMEIYEGVTDPARFERELTAAVLRHGVAQFIAPDGRHVEAFVAAG